MTTPDPEQSQAPPQYGAPQQPNPYGAPQTGGYQPVPDHPQATTILVLGILGIVVGVTAPVAWVMGSRAKREIEASGGRLGGLQSVTIGWILGIVISLLLALSILLVVAAVVLTLILGIGLFAAAS